MSFKIVVTLVSIVALASLFSVVSKSHVVADDPIRQVANQQQSTLPNQFSPDSAGPQTQGKTPQSSDKLGPRKRLESSYPGIDRRQLEQAWSKTRTRLSTSSDDTTPPTAPQNVQGITESIHSIWARWDASEDPESGIDYYAFAVGSAPGEADIVWWWSVGPSLKTYSLSSLELALAEGSTVYISVEAINGAGLTSEIATTGPLTVQYEDLGDPSNQLIVEPADIGFDADGNPTEGWTDEEAAEITQFVDLVLPVLTSIYGPPSHTYTVELVKNLLYSGSAIFLSGSNEIHMDGFDETYQQLLVHELVHAYRDNVTVTANEFWYYDPTLSGFEEGAAQFVSYAVMNELEDVGYWQSDYDADYDFQNVPEIRTIDFWSDDSGTGIYWLRYEMAAAAFRKIELEHPGFFAEFNAAYYQRLNDDHSLTTSRDLMVDITSQIVEEVEGRPTPEWIDRQYVFDGQIHTGKKVWFRTQHYPSGDYWIFHTLYYYETFSNGSEWAYWDEDLQEWAYHNLNGSRGIGAVWNSRGQRVWAGPLEILPRENTPDYWGFGWDEFNLGTKDTTDPWPCPNPCENLDDYVLGLTDFGLYTLGAVFFDPESKEPTFNTALRVMGEELDDGVKGVFGGITRTVPVLAPSGTASAALQPARIHIDHLDYPEEEGLPITNRAFIGERAWASVFDEDAGWHDSQPGKIKIVFVDWFGRSFLDYRNIDKGTWNGNQMFLFDVSDMSYVGFSPRSVAGDNAQVSRNQVVTLDGSASFDWDDNPDTLSYSWEQITGTPVEIVDADSPVASFAVPDDATSGETLTFRLRVRDSNVFDSSTVSFTVSQGAP